MNSPQSVVSPFKNLSVTSESPRLLDFASQNIGYTAKGSDVQRKEVVEYNLDDGFIGVLEVFVHHARDIHNVCIYHKQDVYTKICLTSDPENTVSTKIINGGGKNPVFNDNIRLDVRTLESSLKCEVWMLSRVKNYLEDQSLGFALVPMSEILAGNGKLEKEFSLSSTDLFHSPAGFLQLSISYRGASPEVVSNLALRGASALEGGGMKDSDISELDTSDFSKIEFPDMKVMNENNMMVSEYFEIKNSSLHYQSSENYVSSDNENQLSSEIVAVNSNQLEKQDSPPPSSVSTNGSSSLASRPASSEASDNVPAASKARSQEQASELKEKAGSDGETDSSGDAFAKPALTVNVKPEPKVVQQDIVDMYMKSMQQFTESLAKMKLPLDMECRQSDSVNSSSDQKLQTPKSNSSRVFYGSRAFF